VVAVVLSGFHEWLDRWAPLAEWAVAGGTILLAVATFILAKQATREAKKVGDQVTLQREQMERATLPYLYPSTPRGWARGEVEWQDRQSAGPLLPMKNAGPGPALNIEGEVYWPNEGDGASWRTVKLYGGTVAPGESGEARLAGAFSGWPGGKGYLKCTDLSGGIWLTEFEYVQGDSGQLVGKHSSPEKINEEVIWQRYPPER
jgi:hypothetical protein